jgi:hypothetical protein
VFSFFGILLPLSQLYQTLVRSVKFYLFGLRFVSSLTITHPSPVVKRPGWACQGNRVSEFWVSAPSASRFKSHQYPCSSPLRRSNLSASLVTFRFAPHVQYSFPSKQQPLEQSRTIQ